MTSVWKALRRYGAELPWGYDQARLSVKALILWLQRLDKASIYKVGIEGREIDKETLYRLGRGYLHPAEALEDGDGLRQDWKSWDPDDYVAEAVHRFPGHTAPNSSAREAHERPTAVQYYGLWELDKEMGRLPHVEAEYLAKPVGREWDA